jgi:imidazolonepropionase
MACVMFGLTTEEAVAGFTRNGAKALGLSATHGTLEPGKMADLVIWDVPRPNELPYRIAANPCAQVIKEGQIVYTAVEPRFQPLRRYPANA